MLEEMKKTFWKEQMMKCWHVSGQMQPSNTAGLNLLTR